MLPQYVAVGNNGGLHFNQKPPVKHEDLKEIHHSDMIRSFLHFIWKLLKKKHINIRDELMEQGSAYLGAEKT